MAMMTITTMMMMMMTTMMMILSMLMAVTCDTSKYSTTQENWSRYHPASDTVNVELAISFYQNLLV